MSSYEYTDVAERTLSLTRSSVAKGRALLGISSKHAELFVHIRDADAPTVALELLKAAGQESVIVPKSAAEVVDLGNDNLRCGLTDVARSSSADWARERAGELLAIANYREAKATREAAEKAEAEAEEKKLQERRDEASRGFSPYLDRYAEVSVTAQKAIDAYLELEDKLAAAS